MGLGGALARPGPARPQAGVCHAARAGQQLSGYLRRPYGPRRSVCGGRSAHYGPATTGVWRNATSGKWSACCWTRRISRSACRTRGIDRFLSAIARSRRGIRSVSRCFTPTETDGPRSLRNFSVEIEIAGGLGDGFFLGLLERLFEPPARARRRACARWSPTGQTPPRGDAFLRTESSARPTARCSGRIRSRGGRPRGPGSSR